MKPIQIPDDQVPLLSGVILPKTGSYAHGGVKNAFLPAEQVVRKTPPIVLSQALQAASFDSTTRKIKGSFSFEQLGAIEIGEFIQGVSGSIKISPDGVLATNLNGDITFFLDGETGNATFKGTVQASGFDVIDENGLISTSNFTTANLTVAGVFSTSNTSYTDVTGSAFTITADRDIKVMFIIFAYIQIDNPNFQTNGYFADVILYDDFLSGLAVGTMSTPGVPATTAAGAYRTNPAPVEETEIITVAEGTHHYKLQIKANGGGTASIGGFSINIMVLGT